MLANASVSLLKRLGWDIVQGPLSSTGCTVNVCLAADVLVQVHSSQGASLEDYCLALIALSSVLSLAHLSGYGLSACPPGPTVPCLHPLFKDWRPDSPSIKKLGAKWAKAVKSHPKIQDPCQCSTTNQQFYIMPGCPGGMDEHFTVLLRSRMRRLFNVTRGRPDLGGHRSRNS